MNPLDRINIGPIFKQHFKSFYDYNVYVRNKRKKVPVADIIVFLLGPVVLTIFLLLIKLKVTFEYLNVIITALSIFAGLLFSLLTLIFDLVKKEKEVYKSLTKAKNESHSENWIDFEDQLKNQKLKVLFTNELFQNIAFAIALSIFSIILALMTQLKLPRDIILFLKQSDHYRCFKDGYFLLTNFFALFFIIHFSLTLLMILKRFFNLFIHEKES